MKIKCVRTSIENVEEYAYLKGEDFSNNRSNPTESLVVDQEYMVYAVAQLDHCTWYCICDSDIYIGYPFWYPFVYFEITDPRLSRYWIFTVRQRLARYWIRSEEGFFSKPRDTIFSSLLAFPEWSYDDLFWDSLFDWQEGEMSIFSGYRTLMRLEFSDPEILQAAEVGDDSWLICPACIDAWQSSEDRDAMVVCPKCKQTMHNPRYQENLIILRK